MEKNALLEAFFDIPEAAALPRAGEGGGLPALITGLPPAGRAQLAAALAAREGAPLVALCPDESSAEAIGADIAALTGAEVNYLYSRDFTFYTADAVSRQGEQRRIGALRAMLDGAEVTVITAAGLLQRAIPPEDLRRAAFEISAAGAARDRGRGGRAAALRLLPRGQVDGPGQFSRRGGILDFFSPSSREPVRVELWGDEIDSMAFFDPGSQRRTENAERAEILPAAETLPGPHARRRGRPGRRARKRRRRARAPQDGDGRALCAHAAGGRGAAENGAELRAADRYAPLIYGGMASALDYIPEGAVILLDQPVRFAERARSYAKELGEDINTLVKAGRLNARAEDFCLPPDRAFRELAARGLYMADSFTAGRYPAEPKSITNILAKQLPSYGGSAEQAAEDVRHYLSTGFAVLVLSGDARRAAIMASFFDGKGIKARTAGELAALPARGECLIVPGGLSSGLEYPSARLAVLTDTQIAAGGYRRAKRRKKPSMGERIGSCADLAVGDLVVHENHGIGRFAGIVRMPVDGAQKDYMKICYAGTDTLYVPATQLDLVSKYVGAGEDRPVRLSKMGGTDWQRTKSRAKAAAKQLARGLIQLYAERARQKGHAFAPDSPWQTEFEERFGFEETADQLRCVEEIKGDMEKPVPMDRLLCGDVGYGKTEVALRAVMKCILDGMQAAILVPTTVLAQQHYQTAMQRFFGYPVQIEVLSRFRTAAQVRETLKNVQNGRCDLVIGTHRLLQKDVQFKNLGLLIVDEEQRFGVTHKEHIKELSRQVDVLTLSATPIPRTLNMALSGIRDMSTIEEPPQDRLPVQTIVMEHDWGVLKDAMHKELSRGGQVYYLHNRVDNIERTALKISELLDGAAVAVAHGKMDEEQLGRVMEDMAEGRVQVLVCTTIIETGIDMPNVNTLIVEDADHLGLAQLHQLRGRVGRSARRAYAYLTFRRDKVLSEVAEKRLEAIREFAEFNSGFRIAMRDLEIRGAGNLLGAEQSGHLIDVGYDMYLKLLEEAVLEEKGEKSEHRASTTADLTVTANIPESYVPSEEQRMDLYRRIALIRSEADADDMLDELIDRFGEPPGSVTTLVRVALLRGEAGRAGITDISQRAGELRFELDGFDMERVSALYARPEYKGRLRVEAGNTPRLTLKLPAKARVLDVADAFVSAWAGTKKDKTSDNKEDK